MLGRGPEGMATNVTKGPLTGLLAMNQRPRPFTNGPRSHLVQFSNDEIASCNINLISMININRSYQYSVPSNRNSFEIHFVSAKHISYLDFPRCFEYSNIIDTFCAKFNASQTLISKEPTSSEQYRAVPSLPRRAQKNVPKTEPQFFVKRYILPLF